MTTYLDRILAAHRETASLDRRSLEDLLDSARSYKDPRGFMRALVGGTPDEIAVIAEVKRRSPTRGDLDTGLDPAIVAGQYAIGGAACLSVLTDESFFGGSAGDLRAARLAVDLPVLRKDFTVDARDVCDARIMGADAVLLIAAALDDLEMADFHALSDELGMDALVEIHDETELERALAIGASLVGVNQRDLITFEVDPGRAARMVPLMPEGVVRVAESGIKDKTAAAALKQAGYHALLVGESLVTAGDRAAAVRALCQPVGGRTAGDPD